MSRYFALLLLTAQLAVFTAPAVQSAPADAEHPCAMVAASHAESNAVRASHERHDCCEVPCDGMLTCTATSAALVASVEISVWSPPSVDALPGLDLTRDSYLASPLPPPPEA